MTKLETYGRYNKPKWLSFTETWVYPPLMLSAKLVVILTGLRILLAFVKP